MIKIKYDLLKLDNQICFALYACSKEIIKKYKPLLDPLGLTYTQYLVLLVLWETDNISINKLGERLLLDSGTLSPVIKKLESKNYIVKSREKQDERIVKISLTEDGKNLKDKVLDIPESLFTSCNISLNDAYSLHSSLSKFLDNI